MDTVFLKNKHITNPTVSPEYAVVQAAKDSTAALKGRMPSALDGRTVKYSEKLDNIFNQTSVTLRRSFAESKILARAMNLISPAARVC